LRVIRRPSFLDDLTEAYDYLASRNPVAADRLLDEIEFLVELLGNFPAIGRRRDELGAGIRSFRIRRFNHIAFYRTTADAVVLLRLLHGARNIRAQVGR
jgi:toxin ParE1/3/4